MPTAPEPGEAALGVVYAACFLLVALLIIAYRRRHRWLARLAARRRADGSRGFLARQALRIMFKLAEEQGGPGRSATDAFTAIHYWLGGRNRNEAGWQRWLDNPTDRGWASLTMQLDRPRQGGRPVWRRSAPSPESLQRLFTEAAAPSRDALARKRLGEFCTRHGLVPEDAAERVVFFLLTGQLEHYRAEDPDGSLMAAAYQTAGEATRAAIRETALAAGDLDLLHAAAQRPQLAGELTGEQAGRLARELAGRGDWPRLWRLTLDATLEQALGVAPMLFGWQPPGEAGQRLLGLLHDAQPGLAAAARATLRAVPPAGLPALPVVTGVSFAPDLSQVAVASVTGDNDLYRFLGEQTEAAVEVFALPGGQRVWRSVSDRWLTRSLLHLGDVVVTADIRLCTSELRPSACRLVSYRGRSRKLLWRRRLVKVRGHTSLRRAWGWAPWIWRETWGWEIRRADLLVLARYGTGFAAAHPLGRGLLMGSARRRALTRTWPPLGSRTPAGDRVWLGTDPASGRIALSSDTGLVILDSAWRVLASYSTAEGSRNATPLFCGPDTLITAEARRLKLWRLEGGDGGAGTLKQVALRRLEGRDYWPALVVLPAAGLVACHSTDGQVAWFDTGALAPAAAPPGMPDGPVDGLWASPGGEYLAVATGGQVRVCEAWPGQAASLLAKPMAAMGSADLEAVAEQDRSQPDQVVRQALGLLRACLELRIGSEVALGDVAAPDAAGADDIGLAPGPVPP